MIFSGIKSKERWRRMTWTNFQRYTLYVVSFGSCHRSLVLFVLARHKSWRKYINKRNFITTWSCITCDVRISAYLMTTCKCSRTYDIIELFFLSIESRYPRGFFWHVWQVQFPLRHAFPSPRCFECLVTRFWMITTLLVCCCSSDSKKVFAITLSSYDCLKNENCPHFWSS